MIDIHKNRLKRLETTVFAVVVHILAPSALLNTPV